MTGNPMRCDSHVHIIGPIARYPQLATRSYLALPAQLDALSSAAMDGAGFAARLAADVAYWGPAVKKLGINAE